MTTATSVAGVGGKLWRLAPSDFRFLWDACRRCFYLKVVRGFPRPGAPFPGMFTKIAAMQERYFTGQRTEALVPELPPGVFKYGERRVVSQPIQFPGRTSTCCVAGRFDSVLEFDDGTFGLLDFKTIEPKPAYLANYARQLHAYAHALENAGPGGMSLAPISKLGLFCLDPAEFGPNEGRGYSLRCRPSWIEFQRDDSTFMSFIEQLLDVLDLPEPPPPSPTCGFCRYREDARATGL